MVVGFNIFGFLILLLLSVGLFIYFFASKKKIALWLLGGIWTLVVAFFLVVTFIERSRKPIRLTKEMIVGEYRIDTNFYSGPNAKWQYERYKFYITNQNDMLFVISNEKGNKTTKYKISYSDGPPDLWSISGDSTNHIVRNQPTLYRSHDKFYYVFRSEKFGNMFFRKVEKY